ncbi:hypothetical protein D3C72_610910 [compost metagenome]
MSVRREGIRAIGTDLNRLQQDFVVAIVQRARRFIFVINDGFKHAVFGVFQHRLQAGDIGIKAGFQLAIQRFVRRRAHGTIHIGGEALLRLLNTRLGFSDVLLHRVHLSDTAGRTGMDHIDARRA